jgi:hypothetical protein
MSFKKVFDDVGTKSERNTPIVLAPSLHVCIGVSPDKIAKKAGVRDIGGTHDAPNLLKASQVRRQAAVDTKNFVFDNRPERKAVETVVKS